MTISLVSLCQTVQLYERASCTSPPPSCFQWRSIPWLWGALSLFERLLGSLGFFRFEYVRKKLLLEPIVTAAIPFIEKYLAGAWRREEEGRLTTLYLFFMQASQDEKIAQIIPKDLQKGIQELSFPLSFASEKDNALQLLSESGRMKMKNRVFWSHNETFSQYRSRTRQFLSEISQLGKKERVLPDEPLTPKAAPALAEYSQAFHRLENRAKRVVENIVATRRNIRDDMVPQRVRMGVESFAIADQVEGVDRRSVDLLVRGEAIVEELAARSSRQYVTPSDVDVAIAELDGLDAAITQIESAADEIKAFVEKLHAVIEGFWNGFEVRLKQLLRAVDRQPILPKNSLLRPQQLKILKLAKEKIQQYRVMARAPPGIHVPFHRFEGEILSFCSLSKAFYDEGVEIEEMRSHLQEMNANISSMLSEKRGESPDGIIDKLRGMVMKISELEKNLEIIADRQAQFRKVAEELSQARRLE